MPRQSIATLLLIAIATALVSCSTGSNSDGFMGIEDCRPAVTTDAPVASAQATDSSTPYICRADYVLADEVDSPAVKLLSVIPNTEEYRYLVSFDDFGSVARAHNIERPERTSDEETLREYALSLLRRSGSNWYSVFTLLNKHQITRGPTDLSRSPNPLMLVDVDVLGMSGKTGIGLPTMVSVAELAPIDYVGIQDYEFEIVSTDTGLFAIGVRNLNFGETRRGSEALEAVNNHKETIDQDSDFVDAVRGLYGLGSVSGTISAGSLASNDVAELISEGRDIELAVVEATINAVPLLKPFDVAAVGGGVDDSGERFATIALVHKSESIARDNVRLLADRISRGSMAKTDWPNTNPSNNWNLADGELLPWSAVIERAEFSISGRILLVRMYGLINAHAIAPVKGFLGQTPVPGTLLVYSPAS
jgi:hypothetical protein